MTNKIENCTLNRNWIWNEKEYLDIETWNIAIEAAAELFPYGEWEEINIAAKIRKLKK